MKKKIKCEFEDYDTDKPCRNNAKVECTICGLKLCNKHEEQICGECPNCEPAYFIKIRK